MSMDIFEDLEKVTAGKWVKLQNKGDRLDGILVGFEKRERTDPEGNTVYVRGSNGTKARYIYRMVVEIPEELREGPEDDGLRNFDANEVAQNAIKAAYKAAGTRDLIGGRFVIMLTEEAPNAMSWGKYKAKFEPPKPKPAPVDIDMDEL